MAILSWSRFAIARHINIHPQERIHPHQTWKYLQVTERHYTASLVAY